MYMRIKRLAALTMALVACAALTSACDNGGKRIRHADPHPYPGDRGSHRATDRHGRASNCHCTGSSHGYPNRRSLSHCSGYSYGSACAHPQPCCNRLPGKRLRLCVDAGSALRAEGAGPGPHVVGQ